MSYYYLGISDGQLLIFKFGVSFTIWYPILHELWNCIVTWITLQKISTWQEFIYSNYGNDFEHFILEVEKNIIFVIIFLNLEFKGGKIENLIWT